MSKAYAKALSNRRAKGLDISIVLNDGNPSTDIDQPDKDGTDLAPDNKEMIHDPDQLAKKHELDGHPDLAEMEDSVGELDGARHDELPSSPHHVPDHGLPKMAKGAVMDAGRDAAAQDSADDGTIKKMFASGSHPPGTLRGKVASKAQMK